ncbi:bifunctional 4-hydroxy-2-oxoglutarate aldolase/2-dehydro-3-deoxy-phosphogluconate aldolase [Solwaraspora sp. WMMA2056]|uniref:bifunctional 4-hydroxy-2-oxoglutarate aldolase/2-dehydro-3-deoxy-phosphogluconate aldolase n=1 Tax=Solwaraspora sp. WMMA2056 TaxID=3015161 RepID=UPI00259B6213|nr:bifunctional 4-hydroxy-2-oxoglutarate aldolase/2-dehydro-3-deoxy-phosphogluconate aldolase [Solwaraspora sp. WMMA2056]WJK40316.1 bifunctional 4-hydroxy-2-oxoglutarate aldolase/2-dehydro-3-deoxy-phosphogluconate aldolase [Solwaraspora sp. WMMA2056]
MSIVTYVTNVQDDEQTPEPVAAGDVTSVIGAGRIVPVVVLADPTGAAPLAEALAAGGLRTAEVTFRTPAAADAIAAMATRTDLVVGAGTVLTAEQVDRAVDAGARFVVSPGFGPAVVRRCQQRGVPVFPGVASATEIQMALDAGLDTVKFFPAEQLGGIGMVAALAAPFRSVRFIPTGGVTTGNLAGYLAHPAVLAVGGTWMVAPRLLAAGDWAEVTRLTAAAVAAARAATRS